MYNRIILVGNLGGEVTENTTGKGTQMASFSVATNRKWSGGEEVAWFRVTVFGRQAETCIQYLGKGSKVLVEGRIRPDQDGNPRIWERNDGTPAASFEVTADSVKFLGGGDVKEEIAMDEDKIPF